MQFFVFGLLFLTTAFVAESRSLVKRDISGSFFADDDIETILLNQVNDLYDNAKKAIDTLTKTGKDQLIKGLQDSIKFIQSIEDKVKTLNPTTDLGKVVSDLVNRLTKKGEDILNEALKNAQAGTNTTADHKAELVAIVKELYEKGKTAFETLEKTDKQTLKDGLTKVIAVGHEIQADFNALHPDTDVGKALYQGIQTLINEVVAFLEEELKNVGTFYSDDPIEDALLEQVGGLYDSAKQAVDTLAKSSKADLVAGIQKAIDLIKTIEGRVKTYTPTTDLGKDLLNIISELIVKGEEIMNDFLKNAQAGTTTPDHKAEFEAAVKQVYEKAQNTYHTVAKADKKLAITGLTNVIDIAKKIEADIKAIKTATDVGKVLYDGIDMLVGEIISYMEGELKDLGGFYSDDSLEDQLIAEVSDLYDNTKMAIDTLSKTGKDQLIDGLDKAITFVQSIGTKVNTLKPTTDLGKSVLEAVNVLVKNGQDILNNDLKNAKAGINSTEDYKPKLISQVKEVYEKAKTAYETLEKTDVKTLKEGLTAVIGIGHELNTELNSLRPTTDVGKAVYTGVLSFLNAIVTYLEIQLKTIGN